MKVIAICNLPDGIKLDHAWFVAEDGYYAQKVAIKPLPQKDKYNDDDFVVFETKDEIKSILLGENVNRVRAQVIDELLGEA